MHDKQEEMRGEDERVISGESAVERGCDGVLQ
jgi:hypothetical protein